MGGGLTQSCIRCFLVVSNSLNYTHPAWAKAVHSRKDALCSVSAVVFLRSFSAQRSSWGIAEWALSQREHQGIFLMLAGKQSALLRTCLLWWGCSVCASCDGDIREGMFLSAPVLCSLPMTKHLPTSYRWPSLWHPTPIWTKRVTDCSSRLIRLLR